MENCFQLHFLFWCLVPLCVCNGFQLYTLINMDGLVGSINFDQSSEQEGNNVNITVNVNTFRDPGNYSWYIASNLVSYTDSPDRCNRKTLGNRITDLTPVHGHLSIPTTDDVIYRDAGSFTLFGHPDSIWEKSIVLEGPGITVCGNILSLDAVRVAHAKFTSIVSGNVVFRQNPVPSKHKGTLISVDLFHVGMENPTSSNHDWKILVTDILDSKSSARQHGFCDHLTILYDPDNANNANCTKTEQSQCKKGDLTAKHGQVPVGGRRSRFSRKIFYDANLPFPDLEGSRYLYVALYSVDNPNELLTCAKIVEVQPKQTHVRFLTGGVRGHISFNQPSPADPTHVTVNLTNLNEVAVFYHVHLYPARPKATTDDQVCSATGDHFNPFHIDRRLSPAPGNGTFDLYEVGDLSGKYGVLEGTDFFGEYVDPYLTLYGQNSIVGRSVVIHRADGGRWICANIEYPHPVITAIASFYYPVVGRVIFRQNAQDPLSDTTVFVESLTYSDGTKNMSSNHQWHIHKNEVSRDFYNWTQRCVSAGGDYNPYDVITTKGANNYAECTIFNPHRCMVGDLTTKIGKLSVATSLADINRTILFYTDINLPLSGQSGIVGTSLVIEDDTAPDFRGNRMACTTIYRHYPSRARVDKWYFSGSHSEVTGRVEIEQPFEYDMTWTTLELRGLDKLASGYHVHVISVPVELYFPCSNDAVGGHYNPFKADPKLSPPPGIGSSDQYELGDLSGKYGTLENEDSVSIEAVDSNLPIQGFHSVLGRSVVIHKKERGQRWVCGDLRPHIKEKGARWIQGVASFHNPKGFVYGYVRFGQTEYADGSLSDTNIEINLRYPGVNNGNFTKDHEWGVYVNQVGADAVVTSYIARCLAAGYRWNPYLAKSDRDGYEADCNARNHLACEMGDLSGRHGRIAIGGPRLIISDSNLPLAGNYSVMQKSVVIHEKDGNSQRFACANIKQDIDIIQKVQIKTLNRLTGMSFIYKVREVMLVPEWMIYLDSSEEKEVGNCMQFTVYFRGPDANQLQLDFDRLINTGKVDRPYAIDIGDAITRKQPKFPYRACTAFVNEINGTTRSCSTSPLLNLIVIFVLIAYRSI